MPTYSQQDDPKILKIADHLPIICSNGVGGSLVKIGIGIGMVSGHEKLDVYRFSIG